MKHILHSFTESGEHAGHSYELFVVGPEGGPYRLEDIKVKGQATEAGPEAEFADVASAMKAGHARAHALIAS